jgi:hypothetical protein
MDTASLSRECFGVHHGRVLSRPITRACSMGGPEVSYLFVPGLGCLSVAMGSALVYSEQPDYPVIQSSELLNSQTAQWQAVEDAKVYCSKQGKTMLLQKLDKANFSATFSPTSVSLRSRASPAAVQGIPASALGHSRGIPEAE